MDRKRPRDNGFTGPEAKKGSFGPPSLEDDLPSEAFELEAEDVDVRLTDDDIQLQLGEAGRNWERPKAPLLNTNEQDLTFQQLEVDYYIGDPDQEVTVTQLTEVPILRMYGVTEAGHSVCTFIYGFEPYFYIEAPAGCTPEDCLAIRQTLNAKLAERNTRGTQRRFCTAVSMQQKQSVMHYQQASSRTFLKVTVATPHLVPQARALVEAGQLIFVPGRHLPATTYESDILFSLRFMIDREIVGGQWVTLEAGRYFDVPAQRRLSLCQLEVHTHHSCIVSHPAEGEWLKLAPLRILSLDIECSGRKGHFPEADKDPVIQIANIVTVQGAEEPIVRNVMTLDTCAPIVGAEVMSFSSEDQLLRRWRDLVLETDPDIIIGYNIGNFDLPYLLRRAEALRISDFPFWGRLKKSKTRMRDATFSSKAHGTREYKDITIDGRVQFDLLTAITRDHKLSSYSLNAVSAHFLGEQKEDVHYSAISKLQNGTDMTRRRLAIYCLKDAYLPQRLLDKLMYIINYIEMARVTGVPMSYLLTRGQSIKVYSQLLRKCRQHNLIVPYMKVEAQPSDEVAYEGATVLEAKQGFYRTPVATLDFASLYPSIMMAHNLCYSTLVPRRVGEAMPKADVLQTPRGDLFVKAHLRKGILPEILEELLGARKRAKADLKAATDPFVKAVLDGRQLALKISANSVYGFTGATIGRLPCLEISASVTAFGRGMIEHTKKMVTERFNTANQFEKNCEVIYGDTDSVMVHFGVEDTKRAMELGQEAAAYVSKTFVKPIKLEFEKVYNPYLLINKKRYAGLLWTNPEKWDKMDTKGIETVRRDNCLLVRNVVSTCLEKILVERDEAGAKDYVRATIADLLQNKLDLSLLVITKGLSQQAEAYESKVAHVELAKKMLKRDPATAPVMGDRVPYVIVKAAKGAKAYEKAEDPIYALEHNLPIDFQHYLEHHLSQPVLRIFEPLMPNPKALLSGDHTRSIQVSMPSVASGGIMKFAKIRHACLGCKATLSEGDVTLCKHCKPKESSVYLKAIMAANDLEDAFGRLWTQCQRCQGSLHQDVLCTSRDCPIFYRRKKTAKDLAEATNVLSRFPNW